MKHQLFVLFVFSTLHFQLFPVNYFHIWNFKLLLINKSIHFINHHEMSLKSFGLLLNFLRNSCEICVTFLFFPQLWNVNIYLNFTSIFSLLLGLFSSLTDCLYKRITKFVAEIEENVNDFGGMVYLVYNNAPSRKKKII